MGDSGRGSGVRGPLKIRIRARRRNDDTGRASKTRRILSQLPLLKGLLSACTLIRVMHHIISFLTTVLLSQFVEDLIITCSLGGKVVALRQDSRSDGSDLLNELWTFDTSQIKKVNTLKVSVGSNKQLGIVVGGIKQNRKGCFEYWVFSDTETNETRTATTE